VNVLYCAGLSMVFGAEVIVPLYARATNYRLVILGHRLTGQRFEYADLEGLTILAEHVSTVLENALLYEETALQKTLAETLLESIPPGIVAIDEDGMSERLTPRPKRSLVYPVPTF